VPEDELLIKKYGNRRLYDTEASRYITLEDLAEIVKSGRDVRVVDAKTERDLTKSVLLQIIADREKHHDLLPVSFLKKMIQLSDQAVRDSLHRYLRVSLDAFLSAQKEFEERYKSFAGSFLTPVGGMNPLMWPMAAFGAMPPSPPETTSVAAKGSAAPDPRLQELQEQMARMQEMLIKIQGKG
jgi:polyhydroxyalkanoate synthesis repressor PhaR